METSRPDLSDSLSLIRQFQQSQKNNNRNADDADEEGPAKELERLLQKQKGINEELHGHYERLKKNYRMLIAQLDDMAEAIGACPHCWGDDTFCNYCHGRGKPGYFAPVQEHFDAYVRPVILKLKSNTPNANNAGKSNPNNNNA